MPSERAPAFSIWFPRFEHGQEARPDWDGVRDFLRAEAIALDDDRFGWVEPPDGGRARLDAPGVRYSNTEPEHIDHGGLLDVLALSPGITRFAYEFVLAGDLVLMAGPSLAETPKLVALTAEAQREHLPTPEDEAGVAWRPNPFIIGDQGSPKELAVVVASATKLHSLLLLLSGA